MSTRFFYETNSGATGWYEAESIEEARAMFAFEHPEISPESAGVWGPDDAKYPRHTRHYRDLSAAQVSELVTIFGGRCHDWDAARGFAQVDFTSIEEADDFDGSYEFNEE